MSEAKDGPGEELSAATIQAVAKALHGSDLSAERAAVIAAEVTAANRFVREAGERVAYDAEPFGFDDVLSAQKR